MTDNIGFQRTLTGIRKEYSIVSERSWIYNIIRKYLTCIKWESRPFKLPPMSPVGAERVIEQVPFRYKGLDYFDHLYVRDYNNSNDVQKVYGYISL